MNKLRSMEVFVAVAESRNFSDAAKKLDISSVMVGKTIAQTESYLDTTLLERNTRRQKLTEAGKAWYEECLHVLAALHNAESRIESLRLAPAGGLRISSATTLGRTFIAQLCSEFQKQYPEVNIELELSDRLVDLYAEGFDFVFRIGSLPVDMPLIAKHIGEYRMVIAGSPDYLSQHGIPIKTGDLKFHRCLSYSNWNKSNSWRSEDNMLWPEKATFTSNDGHALRCAALAGAGLILQPQLLLAEDITAGKLVKVLEHAFPVSRPVNLIWKQDKHLTAKHRSFIEWVMFTINTPLS